jgi:hypothetical protein
MRRSGQPVWGRCPKVWRPLRCQRAHGDEKRRSPALLERDGPLLIDSREQQRRHRQTRRRHGAMKKPSGAMKEPSGAMRFRRRHARPVHRPMKPRHRQEKKVRGAMVPGHGQRVRPSRRPMWGSWAGSVASRAPESTFVAARARVPATPLGEDASPDSAPPALDVSAFARDLHGRRSLAGPPRSPGRPRGVRAARARGRATRARALTDVALQARRASGAARTRGRPFREPPRPTPPPARSGRPGGEVVFATGRQLPKNFCATLLPRACDVFPGRLRMVRAGSGFLPSARVGHVPPR